MILSSKINTPLEIEKTVSRKSLLERLNQGLNRKLTLVSAPAGFGKTTLVLEWMRNIEGGFCWVSLDEQDNELPRFISYIIFSLQSIDDTIGETALNIVQCNVAFPVESVLSALLADIDAREGRIVLVLDDFHLITSRQVLKFLEQLLKKQTQKLHLVISTREDPPLSLARMRVNRFMQEIRAKDLRFSRDEIIAFFTHTLDLVLSDDQIDILQERTEGWAAGLFLAGFSLFGKSEQEKLEFIRMFGGSNRHVIDYLTEEVMKTLLESEKAFLIQTSVISQFNADLCNDILEIKNSKEILQKIHRANLFLIPLDEKEDWYRYHHLFADYLQAEIEDGCREKLLLRAALWFEKHGLLHEAVEHIILSDDLEHAPRIIQFASKELLRSGNLYTIRRWLDYFPESFIKNRVDLLSWKSWILLETGQHKKALELINFGEMILEETPSDHWRYRFLGLKSYFVDDPLVLIDISQNILENLKNDEDNVTLSAVYYKLGDAYDQVGKTGDAVEYFRLAYDKAILDHNAPGEMKAAAHQAICLNWLGKIDEAVEICLDAANRYTDSHGKYMPVTSPVISVLSWLEIEKNNQEIALEYSQIANENGKLLGIKLNYLISLISRLRILSITGKYKLARETLQEAQILHKTLPANDWDRSLKLISWELENHFSEAEPNDESTILQFHNGLKGPTVIFSNLQYIRFLIRKGDYRDALDKVDQVAKICEEESLNRILWSARILQAVIFFKQKLYDRANESFKAVLAIIKTNGYKRVILDEEKCLLPICSSINLDKEVQQQFSQYFKQGGKHIGSIEYEIGLLTKREIEILKLLSTDLSGPEIADYLHIAYSTVRSHVKKIYQKIGVHSRHEAVELARKKQLI